MASARINLKSIDYFKFKKLVIDGNRDDYSACSKEVKQLCDYVQTLNFRDEEFDDVGDRNRFQDICSLYKQILSSKRIDSIDMRIKSGWWGDHKNAYSAGKIKPAALRELLIQKAQNWVSRHGDGFLREKEVPDKIDGPGLYVFKHKEHQCFQYVGNAEKIMAQCAEKLKMAFEGNSLEPLAALLLISMSSDWDFYFIPVSPSDGEKVLRVLENDLILKHDCIWPHGLNFRLNISSLLEVSEFRKSCLRHHWPPEGEVSEREINLNALREQISKAPDSPATSESSVTSAASETKPAEPKEPKPERPKSAKAGSKPAARPSSASSLTNLQNEAPKTQKPSSPRKLPPTPKAAPPTKRPQSAKTPRPPSSKEEKPPQRKTQRTPDPSENAAKSPVEQVSPKSPTKKQVKPRASPKEEKAPSPMEHVERPVVKEAFVEPEEPEEEVNGQEEPEPVEPAPVEPAPPEPAPAEPAKPEPAKPEPTKPEPAEPEAKPAPLKRSGTYEVLPTENNEGIESNYVPDSPENSEDEADKEVKAIRPSTLERPSGSRLPIITN